MKKRVILCAAAALLAILLAVCLLAGGRGLRAGRLIVTQQGCMMVLDGSPVRLMDRAPRRAFCRLLHRRCGPCAPRLGGRVLSRQHGLLCPHPPAAGQCRSGGRSLAGAAGRAGLYGAAIKRFKSPRIYEGGHRRRPGGARSTWPGGARSTWPGGARSTWPGGARSTWPGRSFGRCPQDDSLFSLSSPAKSRDLTKRIRQQRAVAAGHCCGGRPFFY